MALVVLLITLIVSPVGVLLGIGAFSPRNSSYGLLFFYLIPVATVIGFAGAILLTRGTPGHPTRYRARVFLAFALSFALGASMSLMTRL